MNQQCGATRPYKEMPLSPQQAKAVMLGSGQEVQTFVKGFLIDCDWSSRSEIHALLDRAGGGTLTLEGGADFGLVVMEGDQRLFVETDPQKVMQLHPGLDDREAGHGVF